MERTKIKKTILLGELVCKTFEETHDWRKTKKVAKEQGGMIRSKLFYSEREYLAYLEGLNDGNHFDEFWVVEQK